MASFSDFKIAADMRDVMERIAAGVVERLRPEPFIAKVYSVDLDSQTAQVLTPGALVDSLITVQFAKNQIPSATMDATFSTLGYEAPADIVRVAGKSGSYFILGFVSGTPLGAVLPGTLIMWPVASAPTGYLNCAGGTFDSVVYPALAILVGDVYGTHTGTTYYLPDFRARSPIGIGGAAVPALSGNVYSVGQKYGEELHVNTIAETAAHNHGGVTGSMNRSNPHSHPVIDFSSANFTMNTAGVQAYNYSNTGGTDINHEHSITSQGSGTGHNTVHPILGINFVIKT